MPSLPNRRFTTYRPSSSPQPDAAFASLADADPPRPRSAMFYFILHGFCCFASLLLGFRFSRVVFLLLFSTSTLYSSAPFLLLLTTTTTTTTITTTTRTETVTISQLPSSVPLPPHNRTHGHVVVGRRGIRIRPWPHPELAEVLRAHEIIHSVQREQRLQYGIANPRPLIVVTTTYVRAFQTLHLTSLAHSLMLVPYPLTWIVVEAGGETSNETALILAKSQLNFLHIQFPEKMPYEVSSGHLVESRMRLHTLRLVRDRKLDGIVVFADESNVHSMELFDEAQKVKWMGAISVGFLTRPGMVAETLSMPIQGPACNSSGHLIGWNTLPFKAQKIASTIREMDKTVAVKLKWAGFLLNSRVLWEKGEAKPDWFLDIDAMDEIREIDSPLDLLNDNSFVEPLGKCGKKVLIWWLRVEAHRESKLPPGWTIEHDNGIDVNNALPPEEVPDNEEMFEMKMSKPTRPARPKHINDEKINDDDTDALFSSFVN